MTAVADIHPEETELYCINLQMLRTSHYILHAYDEAYREFGVRATQLPVLGLVAQNGPVTIKDVATAVASERSVLSRKLHVMESHGWIQEDPETSGKEKSFVLTDKGRHLLERTRPARLAVQRQILARLDDNERKLLLSLCDKLKNDG